MWDTFRDKYKEMRKIKEIFPQVPLLALTATASREI
jgi:superfamily II DNA helicase RecQ